MRAPQIIRTPSGEELVVMSRDDYDGLIARLDDAEEDAADVAAYDAAKAKLASGEDRVLTAQEAAGVLDQAAMIRALRKGAGLTQAELARRAGLAQGFISELESGRKRVGQETFEKIAGVLNPSR